MQGLDGRPVEPGAMHLQSCPKTIVTVPIDGTIPTKTSGERDERDRTALNLPAKATAPSWADTKEGEERDNLIWCSVSSHLSIFSMDDPPFSDPVLTHRPPASWSMYITYLGPQALMVDSGSLTGGAKGSELPANPRAKPSPPCIAVRARNSSRWSDDASSRITLKGPVPTIDPLG